MEVLQPRAAMLSNYEVLNLLREQADEQKQYLAINPTMHFPENLATVQFEVTGYLEKGPCSTQTPEQIEAFLTALDHWKLTKAEKLQILNLRTKSMVELHLIIEECEERFTEEQLEELLQIVQQTLSRDDDMEMVEQNRRVDGELEEEPMEE
ncbi:HRDC-like protein [Jimgerdemannia flammicorona]|uniref:HRDC-like protein n=2 Tax=Jimgerdemannia flammicorona TaxID=994334 RepID=A0A433QUR7_9FUNG|nr:HRDC-like protein [Jimgerdemannia flammicorona]RUS33551.1 HRDC-like protein [Jimgerdemannia flammicorona]